MNKNLGNKNYVGRDEFYTTPETTRHMFENIDLMCLKDKAIYCNCDSEDSEIYKFLKEHFEELKLKHIVATSKNENGIGIRIDYDGFEQSKSYLAGDGDYMSDECRGILKSSDIVVTNPPFSKQGKLINMIFSECKDFILIANMMNLISQKESRPYVMQMKISRNNSSSGGCTFIHDGKICRLPICVITTLPLVESPLKRYPSREFKQLLAEGKVQFYDGTDILNVDYIRDVPIDYKGVMGVPMSVILDPYVRDGYQIVDLKNVQTKVNGKNKFIRVFIQKKNDISSMMQQQENK